MTNIEILMQDRCTRSEAEKHLKNGTIVFDDFEEHFDMYMEEWSNWMDEDDVEDFKRMVETGEPIADWGIVEAEGKRYYIQYAL